MHDTVKRLPDLGLVQLGPEPFRELLLFWLGRVRQDRFLGRGQHVPIPRHLIVHGCDSALEVKRDPHAHEHGHTTLPTCLDSPHSTYSPYSAF